MPDLRMIWDIWEEVQFAQPMFLWLLLILPMLLACHAGLYRKYYPELTVPSLHPFRQVGPTWRLYLRHILFTFRLLALALLIMALARPQTKSHKEETHTEGIDIIICIDISGSMLAEDFKPNRIEAAKATALEFIEERPTDRIGLVIFAAESFTQCPLTTDHRVLKNLLREVQPDLLKDGTAIGLGLATSVSRLKASKAESKVIILLTDGVNNAGFVDPLTAANMTQSLDIRVYGVGVGSHGTAPYPVNTPMGKQYRQMEVEIDEDLLKQIAVMTGGRYFRATDKHKLRKIYEEIDRMEKTKLEVIRYDRYREEFAGFAFPAALFLLLELLARYTIFRSVP